MYSLWLHHFLTLSILWKEMEIVEKEGGPSVFDTDILVFFFFFLPPTKISMWLIGKINTNLSIMEGLIYIEFTSTLVQIFIWN